MSEYSTYFNAIGGVLIGREKTAVLKEKGFKNVGRILKGDLNYFFGASQKYTNDNGVAYRRILKRIKSDTL